MISLRLNNTKHVQWVDRGWYLVTEFEKTPSINFRRAVELAKTYPGFIQLMDERNILIYRNIYRETDLLQFQELYKLIKNWKGVKLYFKGDNVEFETIESGIRCYIQTKLMNGNNTLSISKKTCGEFNRDQLEIFSLLGCVGCRRSYVSIEWKMSQPAEVPCWFFFGSLDRHRVYNIHKEELEHAAIGHLIEYQHCPLLDLDKVREFIQQLPGQIDPRKDKEWKYNKQKRTEMNSGYHKQPDVLPISEEMYHTYLQRKLYSKI